MASPKWEDATYDAMLDTVADNVDRVDVCTTEPTTHTEATSTYSVGNYTLTTGDGGGDWVIAAGDTSGRKLILQAQSGNNGTGTGAANFVAFTKTTGSVFYGCIDGDGDTVNNGSPFTIAATDIIELLDPT